MGRDAVTITEKIRILGVALHGPRWMLPVARDLGLNYRTVQRWDTGEVIPDAKRLDDLIRISSEKVTEIVLAVQKVSG